ncbi:protein ELYS-like [Xyrauchen texanus]|uniref:protein ELYS-like n=1 Tax=Xyrauchen texanus TaxID=154827 RepID=UPI00224198DA|nr:protein ELYS-like [Xyrauchen texanus]XP_052009123.1 protein ELYS-like [Xyrauchen texanus]XP_052009124.1 protein ELYS-like [Xyrauchen texanus]
MHDLAAQVTSSLLRFPEVTTDALGEDEVTLDSVLHGKFTYGKNALAWLACGPQLEVVHAVTGERFSAYHFSGVSEHPPTVLAVQDFCWLKRTGLLVGLEEAEGSMLCLYDLSISRVVKAVVIPGRITAIEPLVSYGGASASTQHLHQSLRWFFGVAAVVTDIGHVLLVDLCLDDLSCSQSELEASDLEVVNKSPSEIPRLREGGTQQGRHLCLQLSSPTGTGVTALQYIQRTNQLAVGFSDGNLQLWNMKTLKKEYHSQLEGGRVPVYAFTFQEPENDPRNCCYLWAVQSAQDHEGDVVSLHLLQLAFGERKCLPSGKIIYEGLEYCEERYSQDLNGSSFPLRAQAINTRLISCQTIEKFRHHPDRDDSMNEVASPDTSVSVFSWQVKSYGQGQPSTFIGVFDINRWYHAQMPDSLRVGESLRNCPYLAVWSLDSVVEMTAPCPLMDILVHERSLSKGLPYTSPPPEQFFNPTTYNFDASCLLNAGIMHFTCSGYQKETLNYLKKMTPSLNESISHGFSRCLMSGLLSSHLADVQPSSLSQEEQLDAILCTAVETSSLGLITGCIKQWTTEEQPQSAVNLRYILEWAWNKVVHTKDELDEICAPLFDSSTNFTDPQTLQLIQHSQRLLANLSTIFHCLLNEAQELTQNGLIGLMNKCMVSILISQYSQVVLWFCRTGLLPEASDDVLQISRPFYSYSIIKNYYIGQREELQRLAKDKWCADCLMIDGLVSQCGERLAELWKRDQGGTGQYPPPSLHALLDIYLLENIEESAKHAIVIYLLLDVMYSFPNKSGASVESFPTAFAIPIGLVKLVQGLWLLDHHDHERSLELLLHPATSHSLWSWQHERVLQALMCQQKQSIALRYLHVMKPPLCTTNQAKLCLSVLLCNRCIVEAWALLRQHCNKLNMEEVMRFLFETCQELGLMKELLKLPLGLAEQEYLERFLQSTGGFQNREMLMVHYLQQANYVPALQLNQTLKLNLATDQDPKMKERSNTRNSILNQYGKVLPRVQRKLAIERAKPYQHPTTIHREVKRPQPLSTVAKRSASENVMTRAAFINNVLSKIEEVWVGKNPTPESSHYKSPKESEVQGLSLHPASPNLPEPFVGTPINMLTKRMSRLLDLVVQPSSQSSPESSNLPGTPSRPITSWAGPKSISKAPELNLLQTPQVVKRARALASGPVFSAFTPQSILRSSLRPTPVATPSASPGRSITPPLRTKESRITFIEADSPEPPKGSVHWNTGVSISRESNTPKRSSPPPKANIEAWSEHSDVEDDEIELSRTSMPSLEERENANVESDNGSSAKDTPAVVSKPVLPTLVRRPSLRQETSLVSNQSDSILEFHDAPEDLLDAPKENQVDDNVNCEVTVRLSNTSQEDLSPVEDGTTAELPSVALPEKKQNTVENRTDQIVFSDKSPSETQQAQQQSLELKVHVSVENDLTKEVTVEQCEKTSEAPVLKLNVMEPALVLPIERPSVESLVKVSEHSEVQEPTEAEESVNESSIFDEAIVLPADEPANQMSDEENAALDTIEEPVVTKESSEASVLSKLPSVELVNHEPVADAPLHALITGEHKNNEECKEESMETTDLDAFVEQHLFGPDLSPPLTRSSIREASDASLNSEPVFDIKEVQPDPENATNLKTQTSVTSSEPASSESRSVVTLNDSSSLTSAESEEESEDEEETGDENLEDSGSEVEIIEEVKGNSRNSHKPAPALYLEELPAHEQYLQEEACAVLSLVTPETQLKVVDSDMLEEGEVLMVGLGPADLDEEDAVCYTPLKPSTTLLVPVELAEQYKHLIDGGTSQTLDSEGPGDSGGFTLMLEPDVEELPIISELDPNNQLLSLHEQKQPLDMENQLTTNSEVVILEHTVYVPDNTLEQEKVFVSDLEPVFIGAPETGEQPDKPAEVHPEQRVEPASTPESAPSLKETEGLANADILDCGPSEIQEELHAPLHREVLASSLPENDLPPEKPLLKANEDSKLDAVMLSMAKDNVMESNRVGNAPSLSGEVELPTTKEVARPKSPGRSRSPARSKVQRSKKDGEEVLENFKELPRSPSRSTRKTVTFPGPNLDAVKDLTEEEQMDSQVPSTPRRVTRSCKQLQDCEVPVTPRRSTRKADPDQRDNNNDHDMPSAKISKPSSPARKTLQKATPRKGSRRTRNTTMDEDDEALFMDLPPNDYSELQARQSTRKVQAIIVEVQETHQEVPVERAQSAKVSSSPSRATRKSTRGLALESFSQDTQEDTASITQTLKTPTRSRRKTVDSTMEKANNATFVINDEQLQSVSRRLTRSRHWNQIEGPGKERKVLIPLELESKVPLADAFADQFKGKESLPVVTEIVRAKRRTTRSAAPAESLNGTQNAVNEDSKMLISDEMQESASKSLASAGRTRASKVSKRLDEQKSSSVSDTGSSTADLKRTKVRRKGTVVQNETEVPEILTPLVPITQSSEDATGSHSKEDNGPVVDDVAVETEAVKPRRKRTTRAKAAPEPPPPVEISFLSPMTSPVKPVAITKQRTVKKETPSLRMNLRRKRMMDAIFPKPITQRKKL